MAVNVDRGCEIRHTVEGIAVYMYVDLPGVWYNEHEAEVGPEAARMAGYPVDALLFERKKREAVAAAGAAILETYGEVKREVVAEEGDYRIVHIGQDRFNVEFVPDGSVMNLNGPVSRPVADHIVEALQPPKPALATPEVNEKEPGKPAKA